MLSFNKLALLAFLGLISVDFLAATPVKPGDLSLMQLMISSRELSQRNPTRSLACFDYYVPILNGITEQYESSYAACLKSADDQRLAIDENTRPERDQIEASATDACSALQTCSKNSNSIPYFECYVNQGSENTKIMYAISANASDILARVREEYRLIDNAQYKCTNASERAYVEGTAATYEELQACLQGRIPVPATSPTPSTPEGTTTLAPSTSAPPNSAETTTAPSATSEESTSPSEPNTPESVEKTT